MMRPTSEEEQHKSVSDSVDNHHFRQEAAFEHKHTGYCQGETHHSCKNTEYYVSMQTAKLNLMFLMFKLAKVRWIATAVFVVRKSAEADLANYPLKKVRRK